MPQIIISSDLGLVDSQDCLDILVRDNGSERQLSLLPIS